MGNTENTEFDFIAKIKNKYEYLTAEDITSIVDKAKMFYFGLKYPFATDIDETTQPITSFFDRQWILSACDEIIERAGFGSAIAYKENGVSWAFDNAQLSDRLCNLLTPVVGVIK